jgi:hypothetical protein
MMDPKLGSLSLALPSEYWDVIRRLLGQTCPYDVARPIIEEMQRQLQGKPLQVVQPVAQPEEA